MASFNDYIGSLFQGSGSSYKSLTPMKTAVNYKSLFATPPVPLPSASKPATPTPVGTPSPTPATSPTVVNKPPATASTGASTTASPARSAYVASISTPPATTPPPSVPATPTPATAPAAPSTDPSSTTYLDSYRKYLSQYSDSLNPTDEEITAQNQLNDIQGKEDQQNLDARKAYEDLIHTPGGLKGGAEEAGSVSNRNNSYILANLGVAESGAARKLSALTGASTAKSNALKAAADANKPLQIGDNYIDPSTGKIIYSKPQSPTDVYGSGTIGEYNFAKANGYTGSFLDYQKKVANLKDPTGSSGTPIIGSNGQTYTPGVNPTVDSWANRIQSGAAKITDIPASQSSLRNAVTVALDAMGNSADGKPTTTELGKTALTTAQSLLDKFTAGKGTSAVGKSGFLDSFGLGLIPGTDRSNFVTDFNSLKSQLSLEGVKYLKGQGQVSDAERALLAAAVTKLNLSQSEGEFKQTLNDIISKLKTGSTQSSASADTLTSPDGTQAVNVKDLTPAELKEAQTAGWK